METKMKVCYRVMKGSLRILDIFPKQDREDLIDVYRDLYKLKDGYMIIKIEAVMPEGAPHVDNVWASRMSDGLCDRIINQL